ncbi:MAG: TlpA disulfide reductase family protein [Planctomycetota bacterium]
MDKQELNPDQIADSELSSKDRQPSIKLPSGLQAGIGLGVASFVLGLVSLPLSFFVIGGGIGIIGLILGIVHLRKKLPFKAMAVWGLVLSVMGGAVGTGFGVFYYRSYLKMQDWQDQEFDKYIGTAAPDMTLTDLQGNKITISELKGKRVVLDFWATWCPPCKEEIPHFIELRKTTEPDKLVIIGISSESAEEIKAFAEKQKINYPLIAVSDEKLPEPYNKITSIPTTFFIDSNGVIESVLAGYHSFEELKRHSSENIQIPQEPVTDTNN